MGLKALPELVEGSIEKADGGFDRLNHRPTAGLKALPELVEGSIEKADGGFDRLSHRSLLILNIDFRV